VSIVTRPLTGNLNLTRFVRFNKQRYPYALISSASQASDKPSKLKANIGQYDIVFAFPQESLCLTSKQLSYRDAKGVTLTKQPNHPLFFDELNERYIQKKRSIDAHSKTSIPFYGGWFVYLSYEMAGEVEPCLSLPKSRSALPIAMATRIPAAIIHDRINDTLFMVAEVEYKYLLDDIEADFQLIMQQEFENENSAASPILSSILLEKLIEADEEPYLAQVEKLKQYIHDGDIFQANLSRLWQTKLAEEIDDVKLFDLLAQQNPSSFAALAVFDGASIISSSPERLVSMRDNLVETRPIAGTRPRSDDMEIDTAMADELLSHPKEQAEHIMLIDLERNDLGRVCVPGTIHVNELMVLESWQHVHHIVSNIQGQCESDKTSVDVLKAVFPGGTITGCPKVRCMEILAEQEQQARGAYTGSLGYINFDGDMDFNILIRTLVREQDNISFRAGGGIVADSLAKNELDETRDKARGLLKVFKLDT